MTTKPTLPDVIDTAFNSKISEIHTSLPGRIESYDFNTQKASVKPLIMKNYRDGKIQSMPIITDVPVIFPRSGGGSITFPVQIGDTVLIVFCERSIERFTNLGGEVEPGDSRRFDLTDAVCIPGLYSFNIKSDAKNNEDVLITYKGSEIKIKSDGNIELNAPQVTINGNLIVTGSTDLAGIGGPEIARVGDQVQVGPNIGVIITGSPNSSSN